MPILNYQNKLILAPMVRVGSLPMRLLALHYGAEIVYSEEIIDWKLLNSVRQVNDVLGTIDFLDKTDGTVIFRTSKEEHDCVVLQLGTCDPNRALKVAKMVEEDVAGIDINMGCPKEFSIKGGMGAALLTNLPKAKEILKTLVESVKIPITCKIRVFENENDTLNLVKELVSTGIAAIGIHGRTRAERPQHPNRNGLIKFIAENINIPVIANGGSREIEKYSDIEKFKKECGVSSVMLARAAQGNCSIFRKQGMLDLDTVICKYLEYAVNFDNSPNTTKYVIQNILKELQETPRGKKFLECQTLQQICEIWDLGDYCRKKELEFFERGMTCRRMITPDMFEPAKKRTKFEQFDDCKELRCAFIRVNYVKDTELPKSILLAWCLKNKIDDKPKYEIIHQGKLFRAILSLNGEKYTSSYWEKNKKYAEQGAALSCIYHLGLISKEKLIESGSVIK
nr:tRNA-dihydrouridine(20) synthase [NAD(P)+]-like [Onthophagus taurus]